MALTYDLIATATSTSGQTTVTLSSIPQTYTDLKLVIYSAPVSTVGNPIIFFNGNSSSSFFGSTYLFSSGTGTPSAGRTSAITTSYFYQISTNAYFPVLTIFDIFSYTNTSRAKPLLASYSGDTNHVETYSGVANVMYQYNSTAAISSVSYQNNGGTIGAGTVFNLYGITAA